MVVNELSISIGYDETYDSVSRFKEHLKVGLSWKECRRGWVFWMPERYQQSEYELPADGELDNINPLDLLSSSSNFSGRDIKDKVKCVLEEMATLSEDRKYLAQFWAPEVVGQQQYLTTSDQPFAVGLLRQGFCWYRQRCVIHHYCVDEGAHEEELGAVGRVYRNKHPESSPDMRLYSTNEFPLLLPGDAARYGLRYYLALPMFDLLKEKCYGVIEILSDDFMETTPLIEGLEAAGLRTTHLGFNRFASYRNPESEITKMLEMAIKVLPQLKLAQVWAPCLECSDTSNDLSCMKKIISINAEDKIVNKLVDVDHDMFLYILASNFYNIQIGKYTNMIAAVMSSKNQSCICRNIYDFTISENPLSHYAQKARLSFCVAICLQSLYQSKDIYLVEFFLQFNSREDAFVGSFLTLLSRIMEMELNSFKSAYRGQYGEKLVAELRKKHMLGSYESSQSNALRYEPIKYKHQCSKEIKILTVMEGCKKRYRLLDFRKYLQKADLHCLGPSRNRAHGWTFWNLAREQLSDNEVNSNRIQEKIKRLMSEIASEWDWGSYALAQFWAPKLDVDGCYLECSKQPFAVGCLHKGLAFFRKQCMQHFYFVDEAAKDEELGPPGRVFLNGHPEITPDLRLYSPSELPLRNHAARYCLGKYFALPVFDLNQHKCVGVLELVEFSDSSLEVIQEALEAANLSSSHFNFDQSILGDHLPDNIAECRELALMEIKEALQLVYEIPQLYIAEAWVPNSKCSSSNETLSCMELALFSKNRSDCYPPMCKNQHVEAGKGIIGMALASGNKSCFCRNLCDFSIVDQPLGHYAQRARLDACFAICLQSWHTGDLLYVLEFYLNPGPGKYEYVSSFLCCLLPIMKQKLKSFKVASGQELGEKLVVEVIEFSEVNELDFSELDQTDELPFTFKFVKYHGHKRSKDKQVQFAPEVWESVRIVAGAEHCSTSAADLRKKDAAKEIEGRKRKTRFNITLDDLKPYFGQKLNDVAKAVGVSKSTIKRICREDGMTEWPWNENHKNNISLFMRGNANEMARCSQQNMGQSNCSNLPVSDIPLQQNFPHTNPESSQGHVVQPKVDMVVIKAKYKDDTIRIELCRSAGLEKLLNEVGKRLNLAVGSFKLKYLDEDSDDILLACDDDLQQCLNSVVALGKTHIQVFVKSI